MGRSKPYRQQRDRSGNPSTQQHRNSRGPRYGQRDNSNYSEGFWGCEYVRKTTKSEDE